MFISEDHDDFMRAGEGKLCEEQLATRECSFQWSSGLPASPPPPPLASNWGLFKSNLRTPRDYKSAVFGDFH